ncbi:MAG: UDP-N-acetylmuramate dehydrogenase [Candidatus Omnitrophota bacterium]
MATSEEILKKGQIKLNEPLSRHTTFKIGGCAKIWARADNVKDLLVILKFTKKNNFKFFVIGRGSNLLISDKGYRGVVISLGSDFKDIKHNGTKVFSGAAVPLAELINYCSKIGLSGLEILTGIPGLVGGSLAMNAGVKKESISSFVEEVFILDYRGKINKLTKEEINFGYRKSSISKYIILGAWFNLCESSSQRVRENIKKIMNLRRDSQDLKTPSCGCIFKNPKNNPAGKLIELCGLKGANVGDAFVSEKHANFIVNKGNACSNDVLRLIKLIQYRVEKKFNICLEPEIRIIN